jgi:hypothetical protein
LKAWIESYPLYQLGEKQTYESSGLPTINQIIIDDSGLFTEVATSQYYIELATMASAGKDKIRLPKPAGNYKNFQIMEHTLVINLNSVTLEGKGESNDQAIQILRELLDTLGKYYSLRTGKAIHAYLIYGAKEKEEKHTWKGWAETVIQKAEDLNEGAVCIHWMGLGYGIKQTNDPMGYRDISQTIANESMKGYRRGIRGFNIFHAIITDGHLLTNRIQTRTKIRNDLRNYFTTGDPKNLPEWSNPMMTQVNKGKQTLFNIQGKPIQHHDEEEPECLIKCAQCKSTGHHFTTCASRTA